MKHLHILTKQFFLFFSFLHSGLSGHGFGTHTYVHLADNSIEEIGMLCRRALDTKISVATWDTDTRTITNAPIKRCGRSTTKSYVSIYLEHESSIESPTPIVCTPTQKFYTPSTHQWIAAHRLQPGDMLLCKNGLKRINAIEYHAAKLAVYTLEIPVTHTFFVGWHGALTHNMVLPAALSLGFSIPFGGATGSALGSFFGPPTLVIGAVVGSAIGAFVSMVQQDSIPSYTIKLGHDGYVQDIVHKQSASNNNATSNKESTSLFPMPNGPQKDDEDKNKTAQMPDLSNKQKMNHIFKKALGHCEFSQELYNALDEMVKNAQNHLGPDKHGVQWFAKMLENGEQMWAKAQAGEVISAGINKIPRVRCPINGLIVEGLHRNKI